MKLEKFSAAEFEIKFDKEEIAQFALYIAKYINTYAIDPDKLKAFIKNVEQSEENKNDKVDD